MDQAQAQIEDTRLEGERRLKYRGTARINLDVLQFRWDLLCKADKKHVEHLERCFEKEGCHRLPCRNHVAAIINHSSLDAAMRKSGVNVLTNIDEATANATYSKLVFPDGFQLECLNGLHRILAGRKFLSPKDKWWVVDLYLADLDPDLKTCLAEEYNNEATPSDGQIYYKMRLYHFQRNFSMEMRWKARLRGSREGYLLTLLNHGALAEAFDALLDIPGLWSGMRISTLHTVMALNCDQQLLNYLRHIKQVWSDLVGGDRVAMSKIDQATVKVLERMAPQASTADAEYLQSKVLGGEVFKAFNDHERSEIWRRMGTVHGFIPSLATFFEDVDYLELLSDCVKRLTGSKLKKTVSENLELLFTGVNQKEDRVKIQVGEDSFVHRQGTRADQIDLGSRQIFAFAMRHYPDMPKEKVRKDRVKKAEPKADPAILRGFGDLANALGFKSPGILKLLQYPACQPVREGLLSEGPFLVTSGPGEAKSRRGGAPFVSAYDAELEYLFVDHLHDEKVVHGEGITSFFVRKHIYLAFFGRPAKMSAMHSDCRHSSPGLEQDQPDGLGRNQSPRAPDFEEDADLFVQDTGPSQEEREQREQERREREQREQAQREQERREREQREQAQREQERREREQREQAQREQEQREREQREREQREQERPKIEINFARWEDNMWKHLPPLSVDLENPSIVEEKIEAYMIQKMRAFNTKLLMMAPNAYFQSVMNDRTHTILLVPQDQISINNSMVQSAAMLHEEAIKKVIGLKRTALEEPSETQHPRKWRR